MNISVNGKSENISAENIEALIHDKGLAVDSLVVEHNGQVIAADQWAQTLLKEGDRLELLSFVGGG